MFFRGSRNRAGAASAELAATAGIPLPMKTPPGLLVHSRPHAPLLNGLVMADRLHVRQTADGRLVAVNRRSQHARVLAPFLPDVAQLAFTAR